MRLEQNCLNDNDARVIADGLKHNTNLREAQTHIMQNMRWRGAVAQVDRPPQGPVQGSKQL